MVELANVSSGRMALMEVLPVGAGRTLLHMEREAGEVWTFYTLINVADRVPDVLTPPRGSWVNRAAALYRWFAGLGIDDPVWDHSVYSKNRDRLLEADIARLFLKGILEHPEVAPLLSSDHFSVDGTLVTAWASLKSLAPRPDGRSDGDGDEPPGGAAGVGTQPHSDAGSKPEPTQDSKPMQNCDTSARSRNGEVDFHGQRRSNATHASTTDPEARLFRKGKGKEARLSYMGHALAENRHGLIVEASLTPATGTAEREAAKDLVESHSPGSERRLTLGADKAYDTRAFVADCRAMCVTPHVAQNTTGRASAIDARTTRHAGYAVSQRKRKLIEEAFGWAKTIGGLGRPMRRGTARMAFLFTFTMAAYDLIRLPKLLPAAA